MVKAISDFGLKVSQIEKDEKLQEWMTSEKQRDRKVQLELMRQQKLQQASSDNQDEFEYRHQAKSFTGGRHY